MFKTMSCPKASWYDMLIVLPIQQYLVSLSKGLLKSLAGNMYHGIEEGFVYPIFH